MKLDTVIDDIVESYQTHNEISKVDAIRQPDKAVIIDLLERLQDIIFPGFFGRNTVLQPEELLLLMRASCLQPFQENPQRQRHDQKPECQMSLVQINIEIPESPVFIRSIADKVHVRFESLHKIARHKVLDHKMKERKRTPEEEENDRHHSCAKASGDPKCQIIKHHQKSQQCQNTDDIIGKIQPQSKEFQISYKKLKHKMIFDILSSEMRVLCREVIAL